MKENLPALIALIGTLGGLFVNQFFNVGNKRKAQAEADTKECQRYRDAFRQLMHYARDLKQVVIALSIKNKTDADYVAARLDELAGEPHPMDDLRKYVEGRGSKPDEN